jgi:hypothetical protein
VEEAYQLALKAEETLSKKQIQYPEDKIRYFKGKIQHDDNIPVHISDGREGSPPSQSSREYHSYKRRTSHSKGEYFWVNCFKCNEYGHRCYECPNFMHGYHINHIV